MGQWQDIALSSDVGGGTAQYLMVDGIIFFSDKSLDIASHAYNQTKFDILTLPQGLKNVTVHGKLVGVGTNYTYQQATAGYASICTATVTDDGLSATPDNMNSGYNKAFYNPTLSQIYLTYTK